MSRRMIEMQYNFPLLPHLPALWRGRLQQAVAALSDDNFDELRPTFRADISALTNIGARWLNMPPERTFLTEGHHHGSLLAMMAMGIAGHPIAVDIAAYTGTLEQARAFGCPVAACAVDAEGMVATSLHDQCAHAAAAGKPIRAAYLMPTVHNPLGSVASLQRRHDLVAVAREFDLILIEDDAYAYMAPDAPPPIATLAPERTFYLRGFSKSFAPATLTAFLVAPEQFRAAMFPAIKNVVSGASLLHARAATSLLTDGTYDQIVAEKVAEGTLRNAAARKLLAPATCWPGAPAAWHLWVNLPTHTTPQSFEQRLYDRGVLLSGGNWFAAAPNAPNGFRIALGGEVDRERTLEGVMLIAEELNNL